jgi:hypothetical protein
MISFVSPRDWIDEIVLTQNSCLNSNSDTNLEILIAVAYLMNTAPPGVNLSIRSPRCNRSFQQLLEAGAYESAAVALVGSDACYMVSRGVDGSSLASVILPGMETEVSARGASFELALIGAYLGAIFSLCSGTGGPLKPYWQGGQTAH